MHAIASLLLKTQLKNKQTNKQKKQCSECQRHYVEMSQYRKSKGFFSTHQGSLLLLLKPFHTSLFNFVSYIESDL